MASTEQILNRLPVGIGAFDTTLRFTGDREVDVEMTTVSASVSRFLDERWTLRGSIGVIVDGEMRRNGRAVADVEPGGLAAVGFEYRAREGEGSVPFVDLSGYFGVSWATTTAPATEDIDYFASDLRLGARAGWSVAGGAFPYIAVRVFGGPASWTLEGDDVNGTDVHKYQIGLGTSVPLGGVSVFAEWAGAGERGASAGLSATW